MSLIVIVDGYAGVFVLSHFHSREYQIGMDIRQCHGNMRHSKTVTFVPRYKLDNRTDHEIVFAQRFQIFNEVLMEAILRIFSIIHTHPLPLQ